MPENHLAVKYLFGYYAYDMCQINLPANLQNFRIHMVGIKGTGMTALTELLVSRGASITGSDVPDEFYTDKILAELGITPMTPFSRNNLPKNTQMVIHSSAYERNINPELIAAEAQKLPILEYTEALGHFSRNSKSVGIAGVHGKTTTTGMVGTILKSLNFPCSVLAGSAISGFNNRCTMVNGSRYFIAETCEYRRHFLHFHPFKIVLTSIESDHQDYYPTYESIISAFMQYIDSLPQFGELIYCADDPGACEAVRMVFSSRPDLIYTPYGEKAFGDYRISMKGVHKERQVFSLAGFSGQFKLSVPGRHNILNAVASIALAVSLLNAEGHELTIQNVAQIRSSLEGFSGSRRRGEILGEAQGVLFIDDYAHHPTAIRTTLAGLKEFYPNRHIIVDFMSHTSSRTAALLKEFASSFSCADELILHKIYPSARDDYSGSVTGETLYEETKKKHRKVKYFEEVFDAQKYLISSLKKGDLFVTMGAGDNWQLGRTIFETKSRCNATIME